MQNLKPLASLYSSAGRFKSYLVSNPKDRFSGDKAHIILPTCAVYYHCSKMGTPGLLRNLGS